MIDCVYPPRFADEKPDLPREDGSAGGGWGEECRAVRAKSVKPRRLLVQSRTPQKNFVFLLEEIGRAQIKKCEQNFSVVWRALASGGGAGQPFRSKWVRAKFRIGENKKGKNLFGGIVLKDKNSWRYHNGKKYAYAPNNLKDWKFLDLN